MKESYRKIITSILLVTVLFISIPRPAEARNLFRQFFRDLGQATRFIVKLPDKITRPLGPVLGPIATAMLTQNISSHHKFGQLFNNVRRANNVITDIEEQRRLTGEVKQMYRDQAPELRKYAEQLREAREGLKDQLLDRDVNLGLS